MKKLKFIAFASALVLAGIAPVAHAGDASPASSMDAKSATPPAPPYTLSLDSWWNGNSATANWLGLGPDLQDHGLTLSGRAKENFYGQTSGGLPNTPTDNWITEIKLKAIFDFSKIGIDGLTFQSAWRYRGTTGPTPETGIAGPALAAGTSGPSSLFKPTAINSGFGMRLLPQYFEYTTPSKDITISAGWENAFDLFLQQPLSQLFENNNLNNSRGIGAQLGAGIPVINPDIASSGGSPGVGTPTKGGVRFYGTSAVPWSTSYAAWGGTLKVKPTSDTYFQSGLYEAIAGATGINGTQFTATSVYPYTSVPASYLGTIKYSNEITPIVGGNGQIIPGALQDLGWVPVYYNNHGYDFGGASGSPSAYVSVKPTTATGGTVLGTPAGAATYKNAQGQFVASPAFYANSPYDQGGLDGNYAHNGLYNVDEAGWTPKFGSDQLEGKYAVGGYIWGQPNTNFTPTQFTVSVFNPVTGKVAYTSYGATKPNPFEENEFAWGMYFQADQQLFSLPGPKDPNGPFTTRGLYTFNEFSFTTPQNNAMPFYFQTGLVFNGPLDARPNDALGIAVGAGFYSTYFNQYTQSQNQQLENAVGSAFNATLPNGPTQQGAVNPKTGVANTGLTAGSPLTNYYAYAPNYTSTEVIEAFYRIQINKWASFKPDIQYIINPGGNGTVGNDIVIGFSATVSF